MPLICRPMPGTTRDGTAARTMRSPICANSDSVSMRSAKRSHACARTGSTPELHPRHGYAHPTGCRLNCGVGAPVPLTRSGNLPAGALLAALQRLGASRGEPATGTNHPPKAVGAKDVVLVPRSPRRTTRPPVGRPSASTPASAPKWPVQRCRPGRPVASAKKCGEQTQHNFTM